MNQQNEDDPKHSHNAPDRYDCDGSRTRESLHLATASLMREVYMPFPHGPGHSRLVRLPDNPANTRRARTLHYQHRPSDYFGSGPLSG